MKAAGFTLVELLIALALTSVLLTLVFNGLRLGSRTADAIEARTRGAQDLHLAALFVRRQLEQAQPVAFEGEPQAMRFVAPLPAHFGAGGLHWFSLRVIDAAGGKDLVLSHELFQGEKWQRFGAGAPQTTVLAHGLQRAEFDYVRDEKEMLPRLVRLRLDSLEVAVAPHAR
jgi:general secretion pathway protein J